MTQTPNEVALLVDGSALFLASRQVDVSRTIDYRALHNRVLSSVGVSAFDPAIFWTSYDPANDGQAKFLDFVTTQLRWTVDAVTVHDAVASPVGAGAGGPPLIRFGERIAYSLGRLTASASAKGRTSIVVLSDQFSLCAPMLDVVSRGGSVWLAFFGSQLDARYHRHFRSGIRDAAFEQGRASTYVDNLKPKVPGGPPQGQLRLIDLDDFADEIWGSTKRAAPGESRGIGGFTRIP